MKRAFSLRWWLLGGIVATVVLTYLAVYLLAGLSEVLTGPVPPREERDPAAVEALYKEVEAKSGRWENPDWQAEIKPKLDSLHMGVSLWLGERIVFQHPQLVVPAPVPGSGPVTVFRSYGSSVARRVVVYQGEREIGKAIWVMLTVSQERQAYQTRSDLIQTIVPFAVVLVVTLALWLAVSLATRSVFRPLESIARAVRKINRGELDFEVPATRIAEVNEFGQAIAHMRDGLKESVAQQAALEQERRLFVAAIAHDLRTPLTSVRGYLEGIRDGVARTPEKQAQYVGVALAKTEALEKLVDGLFIYSKTEYLSQPPRTEPLDLGALLTEAAAGMQPRAQAKGVSLMVDAGPEPATVPGDQAMLSRVVDNLLDNALRYTPAGGTVTVGWRAGLDHIRFWVQDSGPGIPPEDLDLVFQPLYRGDKARGTRTGGAGLGLAIARRLVEAHGGTISVENRAGARFAVALPANATDENALHD